ncbi:unnamed protein product [Orchesella dallaii]|uniref:Uncharacterized protein n=1 Tax=Orchesella dallaii TaxID=48710 RepID=A0ABP1RMN7_9HEXA
MITGSKTRNEFSCLQGNVTKKIELTACRLTKLHGRLQKRKLTLVPDADNGIGSYEINCGTMRLAARSGQKDRGPTPLASDFG